MAILGLKEPGPSSPAHFDIEKIIRPNILSLLPYRCARDDYDSGILLDANENAIGPSLPSFAANGHSGSPDSSLGIAPDELAGLNRYPSPTHDDIKSLIVQLRGAPSENWVFLGVGSDEVIDLLFRVSCVPGKDVVITTPPTYGMYKVTANVNDVGVVEVPLITEDGRFEVDDSALSKAFEKYPEAKLLFLCSPGNPTGTLIPLPTIKRIADDPAFKGIIVVDEAYIDFAADGSSAVQLIKDYANICVCQTLSKGFGLAGIRLGFAMGSPALVQILTNTKAPYNISRPTASIALSALSEQGLSVLRANIATLNASRAALISTLQTLPFIGRVLGGNASNFILVEILDQNGKPSNVRALEAYTQMAEKLGVVVRFRGKEFGCEGCLRITVGTEKECEVLVGRLKEVLA